MTTPVHLDMSIGLPEAGQRACAVEARKEPEMPRLADKTVALMAEQGVSLADLLEGLEEERRSIRIERYG